MATEPLGLQPGDPADPNTLEGAFEETDLGGGRIRRDYSNGLTLQYNPQLESWVVQKAASKPTSPPKWRTANPGAYQAILNIVDNIAGGNVSAGATGRIVDNLIDNQWKVPAAEQADIKFADIVQDPFFQRAVRGAAGGWSNLPRLFGIRQPDGSIQYYDNNPELGPAAVNFRSFEDLEQSTGAAAAVYTQDEFLALKNGVSPRVSTGGGVGFQAPVFDDAQLKEGVVDVWRGLLLEEPDQADSLVNQYKSEATAFARRGGKLDFSTWVTNKARATSRYDTLYRNKTADETEQQYISKYVRAVGQFGLAQRKAAKLVDSGAASGAGVAGFQERIARNPDVVAQRQGTFSQKFANLLNQTGLGGT